MNQRAGVLFSIGGVTAGENDKFIIAPWNVIA
jgi:hypothetical protein